MEPQPFDLELDPQTSSRSFARRGGGPPPPPSECCSTPTLVCDSISASKTKCGFNVDGIYYFNLSLTIQNHQEDIAFSDCSDHNPFEQCRGYFTCDTTDPATGSYDSSSCELTTHSGTVHSLFYAAFCDDTGCPAAFLVSEDDKPFTIADAAPCAGCGQPDSVTLSCSGGATRTCTGGTSPNHWTAVYSYSSEYTTTALIANTEAALPSYPETWDGSCSASRDLSEDESTYSIRRFKYKFTWAEPLPTDCKISWIERTYDSDGNPVSDTPKSETVLAGSTESTVYEVMEPAANGTIGVVFPVGACCTAGVCSTTDTTTCTGGGGTYHGNSCKADPCSPNPC